jgi:histidinol-phosphate/aromatic aminotransferase/cobyric acid decarboxylase-like protein
VDISLDPYRAVIIEADAVQREAIYRARHDVYAVELGQHQPNAEGRLTDRLDEFNRYLIATRAGELAAFVSITPPGSHGYSIDKYFERAALPFELGPGTYEIRLLTVLKEHRDADLAATLMVAAFRWIEARGGTKVVAIGRDEVAGMYVRGGMLPTGLTVSSGAVTFELMHADVDQVRADFDALEPVVASIEQSVDWRLHVPLRRPAACFHGGESFDAVGVGFDDLGRHHDIINADVLDAWFPPAPAVISALEYELPWLLRTSPPVDCAGLIAAIATARHLEPASILPGAGSSDLIFRALPRWLSRDSRVLLLDPTYGEYAHVLEEVIGCQVDRLPLERSTGYRMDLAQLREMIASGPDLVILVNPNSPTGQFITATEVAELAAAAPPSTRVWVDETYIDYVGETVEPLMGAYDNLIVCKSMSKAYALSGARVAYLAAGAHQLEELRAITPPWVIGLPSQVAATRALESLDYYQARWAETKQLREELANGLRGLGWDVTPGCANFLLVHVPEDGPSAAEVLADARSRGLYLRDVTNMGVAIGDGALRIAVKDAETNQRMIAILRGGPEA